MPNLMTNAIVGTGLSAVFGFPPAVGAAIGARTAALKLDFNMAPRAKTIPKELRDYAYLHYIESDLK